MKTKIMGRYVVGYENGDHVIYRDGEVVFEDETILFVGYDYPGEVDRTIDAGNVIVSPGFVDLNALADIDTTVMTYDLSPQIGYGKYWSEEYVKSGSHDIGTPEEKAFKSRYALTQLVCNGITTALPVTGLQYRRWAETEEEFEKIIDIAVDLGLRTYLGPSYRSGVHIVKPNGTLDLYWDEQKGLDGLEGAASFIKKYDNTHQGMIRGLLVPSTIETCTTDLLNRTKSISDETGCPIRLHATQSMREFELIQMWHGKTPIQHLESIGFLGSQTLIPHGIYVNGNTRENCGEGPDLEILKETQSVVVHCPFPMARSGTLLESFEKYKNKGIRLAMGTDCYPSDMIINMRLGSMMCRFAENSSFVGSSADIYRAATFWGANALGRSDLGRLAPQAKADIIIIDMDSFHMGQVDDPIRTLVMNGFGTDVKTVIINGRFVMQDRVIPGVDFKDLARQGQAYYNKLKESYSERDHLRRSSQELFPYGFKVHERST
jgi:5-methylthioadenosine/S-adenosylhomocysteine deaminase